MPCSTVKASGFSRTKRLRIDSHIELQLLVDAVLSVVIPFEATDVAQIQVAQAKAPAAVVIRQKDKPVGHCFVFGIESALVAITRFADPKCLAGHPYKQPSVVN
jgi:hypothetical protein